MILQVMMVAMVATRTTSTIFGTGRGRRRGWGRVLEAGDVGAVILFLQFILIAAFQFI